MNPPRIGDRLAVAAAAALLGRERERMRLVDLVERDGTVVVFVHGPGGIGKSTLVAGALPEAPMIDGRCIEPTPGDVLSALANELGCEPSIDALAAGLEAHRALVVDAYERLPLLDGWMRNELVPRLPATVTVVLVGRNRPNLAWRTAPAWRPLLAELELGPLTDADAAAIVERRGLSPSGAATALRFARGHPLALELMADALTRHPGLDLHGGPPPEVVEDLVAVLLDDLPVIDRRIVEAASLTRRVTQPLLAAVLDALGLADEVTSDEAWRAIRQLPVAAVTPGGLELSPMVQEVAAAGLELRDPALARGVRRRAGAVALAQVDAAPGWAATADLLHLVQNPVIRNAFLPPPGVQHPVERPSGDERDAVLAIASRHLGPEEAAAIGRWWEKHPGGFVVARGDDGRVTAFSVVVELGEIASELVATDPIMAAIAADRTARPLPASGRGLVMRQSLSADSGGDPSPELASMIVDAKRMYLEMRPDLARVYASRPPSSPLRPIMDAMGFGAALPSGGPLEVCALDFGPRSVDGWLAAHVAAENTAADTTDGTGADVPKVARLSAREREVLIALADGLSNRDLAERLFISERTANRHLSNIFTKLEVHNRTAAARVAIEAGLTEHPSDAAGLGSG